MASNTHNTTRADIIVMYVAPGGRVASGKVPILSRSTVIGAFATFAGNSLLDRCACGTEFEPFPTAGGSTAGTREIGSVHGKIMLLPCAGGVIFQGTAREKKIHRSGNDPDVNRTRTF